MFSDRFSIIVEVGQAHDGSLGTAHAYIDAAARAGADAVKFQTHIADAESTPAEPWRVKFSRQDAARFDYWRRMEFSEEQWRGLRDHAREAGLLFLSSPFSREAVEMLDRLGVDAWKVASGEVGNLPLLDHMIELERPILLSSGMSEWTELDAAVARVRAAGRSFAVLQCTTMYPTPPEKTGLNLLGELSRRYECPVGLSDHSGDIFGPLAAVALGASVVEVHVTFSKECFGPDVPASVTLEQLAELVRGARFIETALRNPVDKDRIAEDLAPVRNLFTRSAVLRNPMKAGQVLRLEDLTSKKPGTGIPAHRIPALAGRRLQRDVPNTRPLVEDDLEADPS